MTVEGVNGVNGPKDTYYVSGGGQTNQSETTTNVDMAQAKGNTSDAGFEASGLSITKEDVKVAQDELGIRTSAKTKERVAAMRNEYAQKILSSCAEGCPPELKGVAMAYVQELPMASRGRDIQNFKAACEAKLDAFRGTAQRMGLGIYLMQMEENNQSRHDLAEVTADLRQTETKLTVVQTGLALGGKIDESTSEIKGAVAKEGQKTRADNRRVTNSAFRKLDRSIKAEGKKTRTQLTDNMGAMLGTPGVGETRTVTDEYGISRDVGVVRYDDHTVDVERHDTALGRNDDNTDMLTRNMGSIAGNRDVGETRQVPDGNGNTHEKFVVRYTDGSETGVAPEETVKGHSDALEAKANLERRQNAVLQSMRAGITEAIGHHERDNTFIGGIAPILGNTKTTYRDSTIKWLGDKADIVIASSKLTFDKKIEALTELKRMVEEEAVISDDDKNKFVNTYLK